MWISKKDEWHERHSLLTKFFIERTIQMIDYDENISNRHRSVNGLMMIDEIIDLCKLILLRQKSVNRLKSILEEASDKRITANIYNDYVLNNGPFKDIIDYYNSFDLNSLTKSGVVNEKVIKDLSIKSQIYSSRLEVYYLKTMKQLASKLNEDDKQFRRNAKILEGILNSLIPYLLYKGYSARSINDLAIKLIKKPENNPILAFFSNFNSIEHNFTFLINIGDIEEEYQVFLNQFKKREISYEILNSRHIDDSIFYKKVNYEPNDLFLKFSDKSIDPHTYLSELYTYSLRNSVLSNNRTSLQFYTIFFEYAYWKSEGVQKYQPININLDPINTLNRKSTLRTSLKKLSKIYHFEFNENTEFPIIEAIEQSVFYYNLALGSKSIENSISLLWTSLESIIPYHPKVSDIENIQHFVSHFLSIGSIGRQLNSFVLRYRFTNKLYKGNFSDLGTSKYANLHTEIGFSQWMNWLINIPETDAKDPFKKLNETSALLCKQYCTINESWGGTKAKKAKVSIWCEKIENSKISICHQLDRIYLHRNQIVHSGKFINEYSNMWYHLEWYVGKLLTYCFVYHYLNGTNNKSKKEIFFDLEADVDHITQILKSNSDKEISQIEEFYPTIFKPIWQSF
jgi:hypothetical protein